MVVTRGFHGRRTTADSDRVPPGQYLTKEFPVLSAGPTVTEQEFAYSKSAVSIWRCAWT